MNPNEMTLEQCRDWLASDDGWTFEEPDHEFSNGQWWRYTVSEWHGGRTWATHPFPPTLDAIAAAMPEGFRVDYIRDRGQIERPWFAGAIRISDGERHSEEAPTELLARARLAVACRMAMKEANRAH